MSGPIIKVENLSKEYFIGANASDGKYVALRDVMAEKAKKIFSFPKHLRPSNARNVESFFALKDVSFEIEQGDRVGIIGRNGAGKSTLLKVLSRITEPTSGRIEISGRVASLLEVGTGFHPELTGRENIYLNGAILGMSRQEIKRKFDEIVDFAEVNKFLDTPVKRYSSGMYVRLAFAVAAHLEPEILVVDEVLAVGDAKFQKKCLGKMEDVSKNQGRTVLFVSHNMTAMSSLCSKGILLEEGRVSQMGDIQKIFNTYLSNFTISKRVVKHKYDDAPGNNNAKFLFAEVRNLAKEYREVDTFEIGDALQLEFIFYNLRAGETMLDVTFHLVDEMSNLVFVGSTVYNRVSGTIFAKGEIHVQFEIPEHLLNEGNYSISRLLLVQDRGIVNYEIRDVLQFDVIASQKESWGWMGAKEGIVKPQLKWKFS